MCETITKAYVPHNVGKEQGRLNLKAEERDLWGGKAKKKHLAKAGRGVEQKKQCCFLVDPPLQIQIRSLWKRLGGRIDQMVDPPPPD